MGRHKKLRRPTRKCEVCGGEIVETGQVIDGMPVVQHTSKKDEKRCTRLWLAQRKAEATERLFKAIDKKG